MTATAEPCLAAPSPAVTALFRRLQALEDAIAFRRARVSARCGDCDRARGRCDDHACDLMLIAGYERDARELSAAIGQHIDGGSVAHDRPA